MKCRGTPMKFRGTIKIVGVNPYVHVSRIRAARLRAGWRRPMPVLVRINGEPKKPWKINLMPKGDGSFYLYLHGDIRKASQTQVGDLVTIDLEFDDSYQSGPAPMPVWFKAALDANTQAKQNWVKLAPSRQKEVVRYLTLLKSENARQKN